MRVLFLTHRLPFPPNRGDRIRAFHILRALASRAEVELVSLVHDRAEAQAVELLTGKLDVRVTAIPVPFYRNRLAAALALPGTRPLTHVLLNSPHVAPALETIVADRPPDVVLAYCSGMAQFALRPPLSGFPLVIDLVDVDSAKWRALAARSAPPLRWIFSREARRLAEFESMILTRAACALVVNDREVDAARALGPHAAIHALPNGVDVDNFRAPSAPVDEPRVVFCGVMNYEPNATGIAWFAREVWPTVRRAVPGATLTIVGSDPTEQVRSLGSADDGIDVTGRVDEVTSYLWRAAVSIAPLHVARGVQNKVLEAVAAGLPAVVTSAVFEGLPNEVRMACRLGDTADEFARQTIRLLRLSGVERRAIAGRANCAVLSWDQQLAPLWQLLEDAICQTPPALSAVG